MLIQINSELNKKKLDIEQNHVSIKASSALKKLEYKYVLFAKEVYNN